MVDIATDEPRLHELIAVLTDYNVGLRPKVSPAPAPRSCTSARTWACRLRCREPRSLADKFVKPSYEATLGPCRDRVSPSISTATATSSKSSRTSSRPASEACPNPSIRTTAWRASQKMARGKVALNQDLDRQLFPFASPSQIEDHIAEVFEGLYLKQGGLMLLAECGPDVPVNIEAICKTFERLCNLPAVGPHRSDRGSGVFDPIRDTSRQ